MKAKEFNWIPGIFIISYHIALVALLPYYLMNYSPGWKLLTVSTLLLCFSGISISAGYHRFYSHKAYTPNKIFESVLLFFGTTALEGSALYWSHEHRIHHKFTDTDEDPHSIKKGFMYAHMLWIFRKPREIDFNSVQDLAKNKLVILNTVALPFNFLLSVNLFSCIVKTLSEKGRLFR